MANPDYTADDLLSDVMADLEEKPPRKRIPAVVHTGPSASSLCKIASIANEISEHAGSLSPVSQGQLLMWSTGLIAALAEREDA